MVFSGNSFAFPVYQGSLSRGRWMELNLLSQRRTRDIVKRMHLSSVIALSRFAGPIFMFVPSSNPTAAYAVHGNLIGQVADWRIGIPVPHHISAILCAFVRFARRT
jgi:hypothetical protein